MSAPPFFFPDNTVLINVGILGYAQHLRDFTQGRGRWCATVRHEWRRSLEVLEGDHEGLADADAAFRDLCGTAISPDPAEIRDVEALVARMRAPGDAPHKHLGEAETIAVIRRRAELSGAVFISDDRDALARAGEEVAVSRCLRTPDLLAYFEVMGRISRQDAHRDLGLLRSLDRHVRPADPGRYDVLVDALLARVAAARTRAAGGTALQRPTGPAAAAGVRDAAR